MTITNEPAQSEPAGPDPRRRAEPGFDLSPGEKRFVAVHLLVAITALLVGSLFGPLQAFQFSGLDLYPYLEPLIRSYYQGLTLHGVLNALVWTTFFIVGFTNLTTMKGLGRSLSHPRINRVGFWVMVVGLVMTAIPMLANAATVLYTFYPPLKASWAFYLGLTLVVVGSWIEGLGFYLTLAAWRRGQPGVRSPFIALGGIINAAMWQIATLGVAVEILTMLLPWSLGLIDNTDPSWPAPTSGSPATRWCTSGYCRPTSRGTGCCPSRRRQAVQRLAGPAGVLDVPDRVGPGWVPPPVRRSRGPQTWKWIHALLTYSVFFPSMITAVHRRSPRWSTRPQDGAAPA